MAVVPPWLNVSPSDFLRAMQAGATAGLQVADLRQRGSLERDRLAQQAALAAAARSEAAAARADNLAFQQWERGELSRQQAADLAAKERIAAAALEERGQLAEAQLGQRSLEAALRAQSERARLGETERHQRAMEETAKGRLELGKEKLKADLERLRDRLNIPARHHLTTIEGKVVATDPITGRSFIAWPPQAAAKASNDDVEILDQPFDLKNLDPRLIQGPFGGPLPPGPFSVGAPSGIPMLPPPSSQPQSKRYVFRDGKLTEVE